MNIGLFFNITQILELLKVLSYTITHRISIKHVGSVYMCVGERERERERESVCVCVQAYVGDEDSITKLCASRNV